MLRESRCVGLLVGVPCCHFSFASICSTAGWCLMYLQARIADTRTHTLRHARTVTTMRAHHTLHGILFVCVIDLTLVAVCASARARHGFQDRFAYHCLHGTCMLLPASHVHMSVHVLIARFDRFQQICISAYVHCPVFAYAVCVATRMRSRHRERWARAMRQSHRIRMCGNKHVREFVGKRKGESEKEKERARVRIPLHIHVRVHSECETGAVLERRLGARRCGRGVGRSSVVA